MNLRQRIEAAAEAFRKTLLDALSETSVQDLVQLTGLGTNGDVTTVVHNASPRRAALSAAIMRASGSRKRCRR